MRLKLDENLGRRGVEILVAAGHDVATVPEEGLCRASDRGVPALKAGVVCTSTEKT